MRRFGYILIAVAIAAAGAAIVASVVTYGGNRQAQTPSDQDPQMQTRPCGRYGYAQQASNPQMRCQ